MAPIIGIPGSYYITPSPIFHSSEKYFINKAELEAVKLNGGIPMPIPCLEDPEHLKTYISLCDGLLLPGGADVDPAIYGEEPHPKLGAVQPDMDAFVINLLNMAFEVKMPVLGLCRGEQILNVAKGGTLYQDIPTNYENDYILHQQTYKSDIVLHTIKIKKSTLLHEIFGCTELRTNTMHHQSVKALGRDLIVSATAVDGIVEAIESKDKLILGVQWHPETLIHTHKEMNKLFKYFINTMAVAYKKSK